MYRAAVLTALLATLLVCQASAGGPICAPPRCLPPMCGPQPCCPPPVCGPPAMCAPPVCAPPMCAPRPCCPPPRNACQDDPLSMIVKGTFRLVAGVAALPFKIVGCIFTKPCEKGRFYPLPQLCRPVAMCCPPPMCMPPCPPPACGMGYCPPGMGYGMGVMPAPMGYGRGAPRHMRPMPMAKNQKKGLPKQLLAGPAEGLFGAYW